MPAPYWLILLPFSVALFCPFSWHCSHFPFRFLNKFLLIFSKNLISNRTSHFSPLKYLVLITLIVLLFLFVRNEVSKLNVPAENLSNQLLFCTLWNTSVLKHCFHKLIKCRSPLEHFTCLSAYFPSWIYFTSQVNKWINK